MTKIQEISKLLAWTLFWIITADLILGYFFRLPEINGKEPPSGLSQYFNYGQSTESKILRVVGKNEKDSQPIATAGWFTPINEVLNTNTEVAKIQSRVFIYGMSFSNHVGGQLAKLDNKLDVRMFAGPGAPLNHSFAYYEQHQPHHKKGDVVILAILASALPRIHSLTHMTASFEHPAPHFFPRYFIKDNHLASISAPVNTLSEFRNQLQTPEQWETLKSFIRKHDIFYNPLVFDASWTDHSVVFRLLRRSWGQKKLDLIESKIHDRKGFTNFQGTTDIAKMMLKRFAQRAKSDGVTPIVILFNDRGYSDHLYKALEQTLKKEELLFYSTHEYFPARDLSNFISDGHFREEIDLEIAKKLLLIIRESKI